jgi:hypothetical protein
MKLLNKNTWKVKPYTIFITSYCGLSYFNEWSTDIRNDDLLQIVVIDTGNQAIANSITDIPIFKLSQNVGCSGCWNTSANLGFNYYGLDKIMIGQDDALFNTNMVKIIWEETTDDMLVGAYDRGFTFSLFGLTKNFWNEVGIFDENFIQGSYEDNDYIHRIKISNKQWKSKNFPADLNCSIASTTLQKSTILQNKNYMIEKWGHFEGVYAHPFNNPNIAPNECVIHNNLTDMYGDVSTFPSITEFENFLNQT